MKTHKFDILGLSPSVSQLGSFTLILSEKKGKRKIPIIISTSDAGTITDFIYGSKNRKIPTIFSTFTDTLHALNGTFEKVVIDDFSEGIFETSILLSNSLGEASISTKLIDAVIIAVMCGKTTVSVSTSVVNRVAILMDDSGEVYDEDAEENHQDRGSYLPEENLQEELEKAIAEQDFEKASELHKRINNLD